MVQSFPEFMRVFGGLVEDSTMSYAVQQFFLNGGRDALIVRAAHLAGTPVLATRGGVTVGGGGTKNLVLEAANEGSWSADLRVRIDHDTKDKDETTPKLYNVSIKDVGTGLVEMIRNLPLDATAEAIIEQQSVQVRAHDGPDGEARTSTRTSQSAAIRSTRRRRPAFRVMSTGDDGITSRQTSSRRPTTGSGCSPWRGPTCSTCCASRPCCMQGTPAQGAC